MKFKQYMSFWRSLVCRDRSLTRYYSYPGLNWESQFWQRQKTWAVSGPHTSSRF